MVASVSDTIQRAAHQCRCCNRCEQYNPRCNECCKCIPQTLCVDFDYITANGAGVCQCDHRYVSMPYNCLRDRWEGSFPDCGGAELGNLRAWITAGFSLDFDGATTFLSPGSAPIGESTPFTICIWFKTTATDGTIFCETSTNYISGSNAPLIRLRMVSGNLEFTVQNDANAGPTKTSSGTYNDGAWHCAVAEFSFSGGTFSVGLWVDETELTPAATQGGLTHSLTTDLCRIGCDWSIAGATETDHFDGQLYMLGIYGSDFTSTEVASFCNCTRTTPDIALWKMHRGRQLNPIREHVADNHADMNNFTEDAWINDRPNNCDECVFLMWSPCLDNGVPLEHPIKAPVSDPNPAGVTECYGWSYTQRNGPSFEDVIVSSSCVEPSGDCTLVDIVVGSELGLRIPKDPVADGCEYMCGGENCPCVCQEICVTFTLTEGAGENTQVSTVLGDYPSEVACSSTAVVWTFALSGTSSQGNYKTFTGTITLRRAASGNDCILIVDTDEYGSSSEVTQTCPDLSLNDTWLPTTDSSITADVVCHSCGNCESFVNTLCCQNQLPTQMTATIITGSVGDCPCYYGHSATLYYNASTGRWVGTIVTDSDCTGGPAEIEVQLYCNTGGETPLWEYIVTTSCNGGPGTTYNGQPNVSQCDPLYFLLNDSGADFSDTACCDSTLVVADFQIEITE